MMDFLRKHRNTIFLITIVGFLAGAFVGFGGYFFGNKSYGDAVAKVNGEKVPFETYTTLLNRVMENARKQNTEITDAFMKQKKQEVVQDIIQEEVFYQESKKYGITVTDGELAADINSYPAFQRDGKFDQRAYFQVLRQMLHTTPRKFEDSRRRQIAVYKLRYLIASSVGVSEPELRFEYAKTKNGDMKDFEKDRKEFLNTFRQQKVSMVFNEWFRQLNQSTKVEVYLDKFEKT
jgi:peptidyl-prolyl cis-trans isomerase D